MSEGTIDYRFRCADCEGQFIVPNLPVDAERPMYCEPCEKEIEEEEFKAAVGSRRGILERVGEMLPSDGYVYLIGGRGYFKIGRAKDVSKRFKALKIQLPWRVHLIHTIPARNHKRAERYLHEVFASQRANGEWFRLSVQDVELIRRIGFMDGSRVEHLPDGYGEGR
ncbi:MAG: GIY-YIG nuclease family protein [Actinomycetota bacterium]|nr:GIY-YIG nuclease family protein [Actinomycetota bacterium]